MRKGMKRWVAATVIGSMLCGALAGCGKEESPSNVAETAELTTENGTAAQLQSERTVCVPEKTDPYRTFYEIFPYSYYDSDGDRIGDLKGITEKLDYLNDGDADTDTDLGITGIWLMPIMPSTTYHKYDVTDYMDIDPEYGTLDDFDALIRECDKRDINVIIDLVMNHTSAKHPWFVEATDYLKQLGDGTPDASECPYVDYYHFSKEQESGYVPLEGTDWYYEAQFWDQMPDLNLDSDAVRDEFEKICSFWLERGVSGFRLDAAKEYKTNNTNGNIEILKWFTDMVKTIDPNAYLVAEVWTDQTEYARYYESGIDSVFDFAYADKDGKISNAVNGRIKASSFGNSLEEEEALYASENPNYVNAPFYTNHDLGRSAGYYAGDNSDQQTKIAAALNLFMSGNVFIYYGEEIGMKGSGQDENKRLAMIWSDDSDADGMCKGPEISKPVKMKYESLEKQQQDPDSVYQYYKDAIKIRNQFPAIAKGATHFVEHASDDAVCVLEKTYETQDVCILYNLSTEDQSVALEDIVLENGTLLQADMLEATLLTTDEAVSCENGKITLPSYSVAVFLINE